MVPNTPALWAVTLLGFEGNLQWKARRTWLKFCLEHESPEIFYFLFWKCRLQDGLMQCFHSALSACFPGHHDMSPVCVNWKLLEWISCVHSTLSQCCRGQGWSQLGHAKGSSSQRLTLFFSWSLTARSPCGLTAVPHYIAHLIHLFSRATSDQLKAFHSLWLEGGRLVQIPRAWTPALEKVSQGLEAMPPNWCMLGQTSQPAHFPAKDSTGF